VRIVVVDNGCTHPDLTQLTSDPRIDVLRMSENVGFASGVNAGARSARGDILALVNSDLVVAPDVLARLCEHLAEPTVGIIMPLVLRRHDGRINSAGNPLHLLGYSWAGENGLVATDPRPREITIASGAMLALRHATWATLGGFPDRFFLYQEDVDLSIGCHQAGLRVLIDPSVSVMHDYSWDRNTEKVYYAERNRLAFLLTRYPLGVLIRLLPILVLIEIGTLALGGLPRARRAKARGYVWLARNIAWIRERRQENLRRATHPAAFLSRVVIAFDAAAPAAGRGPGLLDLFLPLLVRMLGLRRALGLVQPATDNLGRQRNSRHPHAERQGAEAEVSDENA